MTNIVKGIILYVSIILVSCNPEDHKQPNSKQEQEKLNAYAFQTNDGWGYAIEAGGNIFIRQAFIPVIQGTQAFKTKADAEKVAAFVVAKIKKNERPVLQKADLQQLGVIK